MKTTSAVLAIIMAAAQAALAQSTASPGVADARTRRADLLLNEMKTLDARIEGRIKSIVDGLSQVTDSKDSRTKVTRIKEATIQSLSKNITYFQQKRAQMREALRTASPGLTAEQKTKILAALDARIDKRISEILALQKSLPAHQDYERYNVTGGGYWGTEYTRNQDFEQNRKVTAYTDATQKKVLSGLDQSISRLESQGKDLNKQLAASTDPGQKKALQEEIARNNEMLNERRQQKRDVFSGQRETSRAISLKEAVTLDDALKKATAELRNDFTTLFARYNAYLQALAQANAARSTPKS